MLQFIVVTVTVICAYFLASTITGLTLSSLMRDLLDWTLDKAMQTAGDMTLKNKRKFNMMNKDAKKKSKMYRYYTFLNEILLDLGWRQVGITVEGWTVIDAVLTGAACITIFGVTRNFLVALYLFFVIYACSIAVLFSVSRYGNMQRKKKLIACENLLCGNISVGIIEAIEKNISLVDVSLQPALTRFVERVVLQNIDMYRALQLLNQEMGKQFDDFCSKVYIFETEHKPGMEDLFKFNVEHNAEVQETDRIAEVKFKEMNVNFFVCAGIVIAFLILSCLSMPDVLRVYMTPIGQMLIAFYISILAGGYIFTQYLQSKEFEYKPKEI